MILANTGLGCPQCKSAGSFDRAGGDIHHRRFNNSTHIGHNEFVVHIGIGREDQELIATGAVSSLQAMPNYMAKKKPPDDDHTIVSAPWRRS